MISRRNVLRVGTIGIATPLGLTLPISTAAQHASLVQESGSPVVKWEFYTGSRARDINKSDDTLIINTTNLGPLIGVTASSGLESWQVTTEDEIITGSTIDNGLAFVGTNGGDVYAVSCDSGDMHWKYSTGGSVYVQPAISDGAALFGSTDNYYYAVDSDSGQLRWRSDIGSSASKAPVIDGVIYIVSSGYSLEEDDSSLYALNEKDGSTLWQVSTAAHNHPSIQGNAIYIKTQEYAISSLDLANGQENWTFGMADYLFIDAPNVFEDMVFIETNGEGGTELIALDAASGGEKWRFSLPTDNSGEDLIDFHRAANGVAFISSRLDPHLYAIDTTDGKERWRFHMRDVTQSVEVLDGVIYIGSRDHNLYAVDIESGGELWHFTGNDWLGAAPMISDGVFYFGSGDGYVYALDIS